MVEAVERWRMCINAKQQIFLRCFSTIWPINATAMPLVQSQRLPLRWRPKTPRSAFRLTCLFSRSTSIAPSGVLTKCFFLLIVCTGLVLDFVRRFPVPWETVFLFCGGVLPSLKTSFTVQTLFRFFLLFSKWRTFIYQLCMPCPCGQPKYLIKML